MNIYIYLPCGTRSDCASSRSRRAVRGSTRSVKTDGYIYIYIYVNININK